MENAMALNNPAMLMPKTKATKKEVMAEIKKKLENAKISLIYTELEEENIHLDKKYNSVKELLKDTKKTLSEADYRILKEKVEKVQATLDGMTNELEAGSTTAFTKVMTSDISKSIVKTLGISMAARTALILAPTPLSKAAVGLGLAGYSIFKLIKNRKEVKKINENNEYTNILMELETTKDGDDVIDTRFNEKVQDMIRKFLKSNHVKFEDTGYRSLRQTIYSLDSDKKKSLCEFLNSYMNRGIDIEERIKKVGKNLNVVGTTAALVGSGASMGASAAAFANAVAPEVVTGAMTGLGLDAWISSISGKGWFGDLVGSLGGTGIAVLSNLPIIGPPLKQACSSLNLATFCSVGAAGGFAASLVIEAIAIARRIHDYSKTKKESAAFLKLDSEKYSDKDQDELLRISRNMKQSSNIVEQTLVDIVYDYLRDEDVDLGTRPKSMNALRNTIKKLGKEDQAKAQKILYTVSQAAEEDPTFLSSIMQAGKISVALATAGLAGLSVYDIIKGGTFLPQLSYRLFPENNMYAPLLNTDPEFVNGTSERINGKPQEEPVDPYQAKLEEGRANLKAQGYRPSESSSGAEEADRQLLGQEYEKSSIEANAALEKYQESFNVKGEKVGADEIAASVSNLAENDKIVVSAGVNGEKITITAKGNGMYDVNGKEVSAENIIDYIPIDANGETLIDPENIISQQNAAESEYIAAKNHLDEVIAAGGKDAYEAQIEEGRANLRAKEYKAPESSSGAEEAERQLLEQENERMMAEKAAEENAAKIEEGRANLRAKEYKPSESSSGAEEAERQLLGQEYERSKNEVEVALEKYQESLNVKEEKVGADEIVESLSNLGENDKIVVSAGVNGEKITITAKGNGVYDVDGEEVLADDIIDYIPTDLDGNTLVDPESTILQQNTAEEEYIAAKNHLDEVIAAGGKEAYEVAGQAKSDVAALQKGTEIVTPPTEEALDQVNQVYSEQEEITPDQVVEEFQEQPADVVSEEITEIPQEEPVDTIPEEITEITQEPSVDIVSEEISEIPEEPIDIPIQETPVSHSYKIINDPMKGNTWIVVDENGYPVQYCKSEDAASEWISSQAQEALNQVSQVSEINPNFADSTVSEDSITVLSSPANSYEYLNDVDDIENVGEQLYNITVYDALTTEPQDGKSIEETIHDFIVTRIEDLGTGDDFQKFVTYVNSLEKPEDDMIAMVYDEIVEQLQNNPIVIQSDSVEGGTIAFQPMSGLDVAANRVDDWYENVEKLKQLNRDIGTATLINGAIPNVFNPRERNLDDMFEVDDEELEYAEKKSKTR